MALRRFHFVAVPLFATVLWTGVLATGLFADGSQELANLAGARTRVVWVQDQSSKNSDTLALGRELKLMGLDTHDGQGERAILSEMRNYAKPLLTPDGNRIVYSDRYSKEIYIVNWDGTGKRRIGSGYAIEVWSEPPQIRQEHPFDVPEKSEKQAQLPDTHLRQSSKTWVYACTQVGKLDSFNFKSLRRISLEKGAVWEPVWDKSEISPDNFQLSADGTFAACEFPWPNAGTVDLVKKAFRKRADGCWASLAPDNSGLCAIFDGPHRSLYFYPRDSSNSWTMNINTAPEFGNFEVFHPRWSNHVRFLGLTGPYKVKTAVNQIAGGGPEVEIYVGRLSNDFRSIEAWARVTRNSRGDFHPDVWIEGGEQSTVPSDVLKTTSDSATAAGPWPGLLENVDFVWENSSAPNRIAGQGGAADRVCRVEARGRAWFNRYFDMDCSGGSFVAEPFGHELLDGCRDTNEFTIEVAITPDLETQSGPASIIAFGSKSDHNFLLCQDGSNFVLDLKTRRSSAVAHQTTVIQKVQADQLQHLILSYSHGTLSGYVNGQQVVSTPATDGDFSAWTEGGLVFGADGSGKSPWKGRLEGIAISHRALTPDEARRNYEQFVARLDQRISPNQIRVRVKCVETSQIPDPRTIVPYRRALIVSRFRIEKVMAGQMKESEILIAQWGILDKNIVKESRLKIGQTLELILERFEDHPELTSERQVLDVEGLELPWYYAVEK